MKLNRDKLNPNHPYSANKFYCPCCRSISDQYKSIEKFQRLLLFITEESELIFPITSAFRCLTQNKKVGGAEKSDHLSMLAIDVGYSTSVGLYQFLKYMFAYDRHLRYRYIRIYKNHIHISLESPIARTYDNKSRMLTVAW